jgi:hypothetical protein
MILCESVDLCSIIKFLVFWLIWLWHEMVSIHAWMDNSFISTLFDPMFGYLGGV